MHTSVGAVIQMHTVTIVGMQTCDSAPVITLRCVGVQIMEHQYTEVRIL